MNYNEQLNINIYNDELKIFEENNSRFLTKIELLDWNTERVIKSIEGYTSAGTRTEDGNSIIRNTISLTFVANNNNYQLLNPNNEIYPNKKIKLYEGIVNKMTNGVPKWYPKGVYILTSPSINYSSNAYGITINASDKMCLCDGSISGKIDFSTRVDAEYKNINTKSIHISEAADEYNKILNQELKTQSELEDSKAYIILKLREYLYYVASTDYTQENTVLTLINSIENIQLTTSIYDLKGYSQSFSKLINNTYYSKLKISEIIRYIMIEYAHENPAKIIINDIPDKIKTPIYIYNKDNENKKVKIGYKMIDYIYPEELVVSAGTPVTTVLDSCVQALGGNFEYFYDYNGNFIFQEKKNYINNNIVDINNLEPSDYKYKYDYFPIHFDFSNTKIISSYSNSASWSNIKNDISVWGNDEEKTLGYRVVIDTKPAVPLYIVNQFNDSKKLDWREYIIYNYEIGINNNLVGKNKGEVIAADYNIDIDNPVIVVCPEDRDEKYYYKKYNKKNKTWEKLIISDEDKGSEIPRYYPELSTLWFGDRFYSNGEPQDKGVYNYNLDLLAGDVDFNKWRIESIGERVESITDNDVKQLYPAKIEEILVYVNEDDLQYTTDKDAAIKLDSYDEFRNYAPAGNIYKDAYSAVKEQLFKNLYSNEQITITSLPILTLSTNNRCYGYNLQAQMDGYYLTQTINIDYSTYSMTTTLVKILPKDVSRDTKDFWYIVTEDKEENITTEEGKYLVNELSDTSSI